jgi:hypothetical protein
MRLAWSGRMLQRRRGRRLRIRLLRRNSWRIGGVPRRVLVVLQMRLLEMLRLLMQGLLRVLVLTVLLMRRMRVLLGLMLLLLQRLLWPLVLQLMLLLLLPLMLRLMLLLLVLLLSLLMLLLPQLGRWNLRTTCRLTRAERGKSTPANPLHTIHRCGSAGMRLLLVPITAAVRLPLGVLLPSTTLRRRRIDKRVRTAIVARDGRRPRLRGLARRVYQ